MRIDEEDRGSYNRRQNLNQPRRSNNKNWLIILSFLALVAIIIGLLRVNLLTGETPIDDIAEQVKSDNSANPVAKIANNQNIAATKIQELSQEINELQDLKKQVEFLVGANQRDNAQFRKIDTELENLSTTLASLERNINSLSSKIEQLDTQMQAELVKQSETNSLANENLDKIRTDLINLNSLYNSQLESIDELESNLININGRVTELER